MHALDVMQRTMISGLGAAWTKLHCEGSELSALGQPCMQGRIQDFLQGGGGVNDRRVQRAPLAPAPTGGLGLINIRLRYIASIEYSDIFFIFLLGPIGPS